MGRKKQKPHTLIHLAVKRLMRDRNTNLHQLADRLTATMERPVTYAQLWRRITVPVTSIDTIQLMADGLGMAESALLRTMKDELAAAREAGVEVIGLELTGRISFNGYCREKLRRIHAPVPSFGGKGRDVHRLLAYLPPHHTYVEVFGGAGSLLFAKEPSSVEVINDINGDIVNFFRVLRNRPQFEEFQRMAAMTPYSREQFHECRGLLHTGNAPEVERAWAYFVVVRQSFAARLHHATWGASVTESARKMGAMNSKWLSAIDRLPEAHDRLQRVQIDKQDFRAILHRYDTPSTLFYLDPPYPPATRGQARYEDELAEADHEELVNLIQQLEGRCLVTVYPHPLYDRLGEAGWTQVDWQAPCYAKGAAQSEDTRTTHLWASPVR